MRGMRTAILLTALLALGGTAAGQDAKDKDGRFQNLTVEQWTDLLRFPDGSVRRRAAKVLPDFGPSVAPTLLGALHDPDEQVRRMAADGLVRFGSPSVPALAAALRPADSVVRYQVAEPGNVSRVDPLVGIPHGRSVVHGRPPLLWLQHPSLHAVDCAGGQRRRHHSIE